MQGPMLKPFAAPGIAMLVFTFSFSALLSSPVGLDNWIIFTEQIVLIAIFYR